MLWKSMMTSEWHHDVLRAQHSQTLLNVLPRKIYVSDFEFWNGCLFYAVQCALLPLLPKAIDDNDSQSANCIHFTDEANGRQNQKNDAKMISLLQSTFVVDFAATIAHLIFAFANAFTLLFSFLCFCSHFLETRTIARLMNFIVSIGLLRCMLRRERERKLIVSN